MLVKLKNHNLEKSIASNSDVKEHNENILNGRPWVAVGVVVTLYIVGPMFFSYTLTEQEMVLPVTLTYYIVLSFLLVLAMVVGSEKERMKFFRLQDAILEQYSTDIEDDYFASLKSKEQSFYDELSDTVIAVNGQDVDIMFTKKHINNKPYENRAVLFTSIIITKGFLLTASKKYAFYKMYDNDFSSGRNLRLIANNREEYKLLYKGLFMDSDVTLASLSKRELADLLKSRPDIYEQIEGRNVI